MSTATALLIAVSAALVVAVWRDVLLQQQNDRLRARLDELLRQRTLERTVERSSRRMSNRLEGRR